MATNEIPLAYSGLFAELKDNTYSLSEDRNEVVIGQVSNSRDGQFGEFLPLSAEQKGAAFLKAARTSVEKQKDSLLIERKTLRKRHATKLWKLRQKTRDTIRRQEDAKSRLLLSQELLKVEKKYQDVVSLAAHECLEMVFKICKMVLQQELRNNTDCLQKIIDSELQHLQYKRIKEIQVHPTHLALASSFDVHVRANELLGEDEACIVTASGEIQISVSQDLLRLKEELQSLLIMHQEHNAFSFSRNPKE